MWIKLRKNLSYLIFLSFFAFTSELSAIAEEKSALINLSLQELLTLKIASRQNDTLYSAPSSVSLITSEQIKQMGLNNLQAILNFIPGYQSSRDIEQGTTNRITARGRSTALSESVLVLIDGQRLNDLYSGGIPILNRLLELGHVEKIEIIRGPGSALYGSNAFLGTINIITASNINQLKFQAGSFGEKFGSLHFSHTFSNRHNNSNSKSVELNTLDLFISSFNQSGENYSLPDFFGTETDTYDPINGHDLYLKYRVRNWSFQARHMRRDLNQFLTFGNLSNRSNLEETQQTSISAEYHKTVSAKFEYSLQVSHSEDQWNTRALLLPENTEIAPGVFLGQDFVGGPFLQSKNTKAAWDSRYQLSNDNTLLFGASFETAKISDVANVTTHNPITLDFFGGFVFSRDELNFNDRNKREIKSFYIQYQHSFSSRWLLTSGIRHDDYSDFGNSNNPRVALVWRASDKNSIKFLYGTAFRAPNFLELYDKNNPVDFGNINLNPEKVKTTEVAWLFSNNRWQLELAAFHNHFQDLIVLGAPIVDPNNPLLAPSFSNSNSAHTAGLETEYQIELMEDIQLKLIGNWFTDDSDINVSKNSGALVLNYKLPDVNINVSSFYRGKNKNIENQASYFVTNFNLRYLISQQTTLIFSSENLFNEQYRTLSSVYPEGIPNRGSSIRLGIEINF